MEPKNYINEIEILYKRSNWESEKFDGSVIAAKVLYKIFPKTLDHREYFYILLLDRSNHIVSYYHIGTGGLSGTVADPKVIFQTALKCNACAIILAHNHPSGNIRPSEADIRLTRKVKAGGELLDIVVMDHIILSSDRSYFSFADEGML